MNKSMLDEYLLVLNINDEIKTIEDITRLIHAHEKTFAFSSVKVLLENEISLEIEDIFESIVIKKRAGYCFEHNKLFYEVLKALGFDVHFFLARVVNNLDVEVPQTHRFTHLHFEREKYLIDVGIGFRSPSVPVKFGKDITYSNFGISYNIKEFKNGAYSLQLLQEDKAPFTLTKFTLNPCFEADFEMGHFYSHKHPKAVFVNNLVISLICENEIRSLRNSDYFKINKDKQECIKIEGLEEFIEIMNDDFNTNFTNEELEFIFKKYVKNGE